MRTLSRRWPLLILLGLALCRAALAAPCPETLRVGVGDSAYPPAVHGSGPAFADPPGWAVVAVREAAQRLGCTLKLQRLPMRRIALALEQGQLEFGMFFGATPERLEKLRFPLDTSGRADAAWAPVIGHMAFYALPGSPARQAWDGQHLAAGVSVGATGGATQELLARSRGWPVEVASSSDSSVLALRARRFDLLLIAREALAPEQLTGENALVELAPVVQYLPYFVPASRAVQERHADFVTSFWHELCQATRRLAPEARGMDCGVRPRVLEPSAPAPAKP